MEILKVIIIAIVAIVLIIVVGTYNKEQALMIRLSTCVLLLFLSISKIEVFKEIFISLSNIQKIDNMYIEIILKIIGIAYLVEIASEISKDAGENAIASNLLLAGKVIILYMSTPIVLSFINIMTQIIN